MPSILHPHRTRSPQKLALDLAEKAISFRSVVQHALGKEFVQYKRVCPNKTEWNIHQGDWTSFPLLYRYLMFHTQLTPLEKSNKDEDRYEGFASFADMYAQTVTYGLLAARWISKDQKPNFRRAIFTTR